MVDLFGNDAKPCCRRCGGTETCERWQKLSDGRRALRLECGHCGQYLRYLPQRKAGKPKASGTNLAQLLVEIEDDLLTRLTGDPALAHRG